MPKYEVNVTRPNKQIATYTVEAEDAEDAEAQGSEAYFEDPAYLDDDMLGVIRVGVLKL
jgi:hypothetical protein